MRKDDHLIFEAFSNTLNSVNNKQTENEEDMSKWDRGNYIVDLQDNIIGEFLGNSNISELKLGNDVKHLNSGYAQTINWGTHIGLWSRNKRHRLVLRNPDKWDEFFSGLKEENAETPEQRQERIARKWELNKKRWAKWKAENPEKAKLNAQRKAGIYDNKEENAEDMSESPFHYDPMHGLASAAHKIRDELRGAANDEARPEHIEKMAEIILGPQSEYASVDHYEKALSGVIELLNHYVNVPMN